MHYSKCVLTKLFRSLDFDDVVGESICMLFRALQLLSLLLARPSLVRADLDYATRCTTGYKLEDQEPGLL